MGCFVALKGKLFHRTETRYWKFRLPGSVLGLGTKRLYFEFLRLCEWTLDVALKTLLIRVGRRVLNRTIPSCFELLCSRESQPRSPSKVAFFGVFEVSPIGTHLLRLYCPIRSYNNQSMVGWELCRSQQESHGEPISWHVWYLQGLRTLVLLCCQCESPTTSSHPNQHQNTFFLK